MSNLRNVDRLHAEFQRHPMFKDTVTKARSFGNVWEMECDETIRNLWPKDAQLAAAVDGYYQFALEIMRLQVDFMRTGVYLPQTYAEAEAAVYANDAYMRDTYLPGLLLAWYLWPHHYRQLQFFRTFVRDMSRSNCQKFYEVATGTGVYSRIALQGAQSAVGVGFDISPASCAFTENHITAFCCRERYKTVLLNVMEDSPEPVDWLICVELLEHLPDPMALLRTLRRMLRPGGRAFIATALNAPNSDHLYLYRTGDEIMGQLYDAGFHVIQSQFNAAYPTKTPPTVAAFICS